MQWLKKNLSLLIILVITVIYLLLIFHITDLATFKTLELNEMGDFLAGGFAPLAFLWLVFGYLQQGKELKLQAQELKNSVEQQTKLVDTAKKELEITINKITKDNQLQLIQAQPFFHITEIVVKVMKANTMIDFSISFKIKNSRIICRDLFFLFSLNEEDPSIIPDNSTSFDLLDINTTRFEPAYFQATISGEIIKDFNSKFFLHFCYTDAFDKYQQKTFKINLFQENLLTYKYDSYVSQSQKFY